MARKVKLKISTRLLKKRTKKNGFKAAKHCKFCTKSEDVILDYKNVSLLKHFVTERGKILPSRISGACAKHQRALTTEIKNARVMALLPYVAPQA